jgi:hypothetical protein
MGSFNNFQMILREYYKKLLDLEELYLFREYSHNNLLNQEILNIFENTSNT